jgi:hypothetical protein
MIRAPFLIALPFAVGATCALASDINPFGLYLGGAAGHANVRTRVRTAEPAQLLSDVDLDESDTAWKVDLGMRSIRLLAAELEYVDFGHARSTSNVGFLHRPV